MALQVWLPLNGDLHNQGLNNITVTNNNAIINNNGKLGKCYQFGTSGSDITLPASVMTSYTTECSVTFWLNILTQQTAYATYFQAGPAGTAWTSYIFGFLRNNTSSTCCFTISNGSSASNANYLTPVLNLNTWYHIALIYKTGHCLIYINGVLSHDYSTSIVPDFTKITTIKIGRCTNGSSYQTNCLMNDFRIYDRALSAKEVEEISRGLILHYPLNDRYMENITNLATGLTAGARTTVNNGVVTTTGENGDTYFTVNLSETLAVGTTYTVSCWADMPEGSSWNFPIGKQASGISWYLSPGYNEKTFTPTDVSGWGNNRLFLDDASGRVTSSSCRFYNFQVEKKNYAAPFIGYGASHIASTVYDCSGYSHNGSIVNNLKIITSSPRYGYAVSFDNGQYIKKTDLHFANNIWSVSCWFKKTSNLTNTYETILGYTKGNGADANKKFSIYTYNNKIGCVAEKTANTNIVTVNADLWHHVCLVNNAGSYTCYLDGASIKTFTNTNCLTDCTDFVVGGRAAAENATSIGTPWTGYVSDVRFYATALTIDQVKELYNTSMSIDVNGNIYARELVE